ncbi:Rh158.3 [macacine betaherpesvirus 3]|uniref:UL146b n=1 Tax=Rhesus cytomegalovirus (strain 68-1) TaxID=47929 RepID=A8D108_RHCM6|nr:RhUL146b [macacine betaherpesvirus 3]QQL10811.1 Rh158.3 [Rhesus cytomegalovirus strain 68-1_FL]ADD92462.1 UL146b [macacine betaherpesvirus 3]AGM37936.1 RhUL146b [macacine betaherpesvirus 3]QQL11351.1 Rh158.3 [macacine betaherpesvirus 3]
MNRAIFNPRVLGVALLLMTLIAHHQTAAELRCQCLQVMKGIPPSNIQRLSITRPNAGCERREIIATLKNGKQVCLDPEAPMMKKMLSKIPGGTYPSFWEHLMTLFRD